VKKNLRSSPEGVYYIVRKRKEIQTATPRSTEMKKDRKVPENNFIPETYEQMFSHYFIGDGNGNSLAASTLKKFLPFADQDEVQVLLQDSILKAMKCRVIEKFDPEKANFGGAVFFVVRSICVNHLKRKSRNPVTGLSAGSLVEASSDSDEGFTAGEWNLDHVFPAKNDDPEGSFDARSIVEKLTIWTKQMMDAPSHKRDECLHPLLALLAEGRDPKECSEELGVTVSTIHNWRQELKEMALALA
jgi:DNA-directed RNA polymerase specialized sigma24 family protein